MSLSHLLPAVGERGALRGVLDRLHAADRVVTFADVPDSFRAPLTAALVAEEARPVLVVTARSDRADAICQQLTEYLPAPLGANVWPAPEALPYEQLPFDLAVSTQRV